MKTKKRTVHTQAACVWHAVRIESCGCCRFSPEALPQIRISM